MPLRVLVVLDSFKGSLTSRQANEAVRQGIWEAIPEACVEVCSFGDGGEGTMQAILDAHQWKLVEMEVLDALHEPRQAQYAILSDQTALMEMAQAAPLSKKSVEDPFHTDTWGVGQMIADAIGKGCRKFIIGIGGSASTDGGKGMLEALGFRFLDEHHQPTIRGNEGCGQVAFIESAHALPALKECTFQIACDVTNPLCGKNGAAYVYGPQKGLQPEDLPIADAHLQIYAVQAEKWRWQNSMPSPRKEEDSIRDVKELPGAGAAGGLGFAFVNFLNGELIQGADLVMETTNLPAKMAACDVVVTGEGSFDVQSLMGKGPGQIIKLAKELDKKVLVFGGRIALDPWQVKEAGLDGCFSIVQAPCTLEQAMETSQAAANLQTCAFQVFMVIKAFSLC